MFWDVKTASCCSRKLFDNGSLKKKEILKKITKSIFCDRRGG